MLKNLSMKTHARKSNTELAAK